MGVRQATAGDEVLEVSAGELDDGRALAFRCRRVSALDLAEYDAGMVLATPRDVAIDAARAMRGLDDTPPPPTPPEALAEDATPEQADEYHAALVAYEAARREWEEEIIPALVDRRRKAESKMGSRDRARAWQVQAALVQAAVVAVRVGGDDWEAERFADVAIEDEQPDGPTSLHRLPPATVPHLATLIHSWLTGGDAARRRVSRFRVGPSQPAPAGSAGAAVRGASE